VSVSRTFSLTVRLSPRLDSRRWRCQYAIRGRGPAVWLVSDRRYDSLLDHLRTPDGGRFPTLQLLATDFGSSI
jgi:hypothetical protein